VNPLDRIAGALLTGAPGISPTLDGAMATSPLDGYTPEQVHVLYWQRPTATRLPKPGDLVDYRHEYHGTTELARVVSVHMDNRADPNVWEPDGHGHLRMRHDPAPDVVIELEHGARYTCRECRVPNTPGWSWP